MNCNIVGVNAYLNEMNWSGKTAFYKATRGLWNVNGTLAGYARSYPSNNQLYGPSLTEVVVLDAGHEVPFFQPVSALDMFRRFVQGTAWF